MKQLSLFNKEYVIEFRKNHRAYKIIFTAQSEREVIRKFWEIIESKEPGSWRLKHSGHIIGKHFMK